MNSYDFLESASKHTGKVAATAFGLKVLNSAYNGVKGVIARRASEKAAGNFVKKKVDVAGKVKDVVKTVGSIKIPEYPTKYTGAAIVGLGLIGGAYKTVNAINSATGGARRFTRGVVEDGFGFSGRTLGDKLKNLSGINHRDHFKNADVKPGKMLGSGTLHGIVYATPSIGAAATKVGDAMSNLPRAGKFIAKSVFTNPGKDATLGEKIWSGAAKATAGVGAIAGGNAMIRSHERIADARKYNSTYSRNLRNQVLSGDLSPENLTNEDMTSVSTKWAMK